MAAGENFLPALVLRGGQPAAFWKPLWDAAETAEKIKFLAETFPPSALAPILDPKTLRSPMTGDELVKNFLADAVDQEVRRASGKALALSHPDTAQESWLAALASENGVIPAPAGDVAALADSLRDWEDRRRAPCREGLRVVLRLSPPPPESVKWTLEYFLQPTADPSFLVSAKDLWRDPALRRKLAVFSPADPDDILLTALGLAGRLFAPIESGLKKSKPSTQTLDAQQAYAFLQNAAPALALAGFGVLLPPWWRSKAAPRLGLRVKLKPRGEGAGLADSLDLDWELALGDKLLSVKELEALAELKIPLVQIRGQWVEVDPATLKEALDHWNRLAEKPRDFGEILRTLRESGGLEIESVTGEGWIKELFEGSEEGNFKILPPPEGLQAELRLYQERGFSWLSFLGRLGLGACLADDMGLGKTLQTLAFLLREKTEGRLDKPALLLCPTSVAGNWVKEAQRFTPGLRVHLRHGLGRTRSADSFQKETGKSDLVVTTYGLARREEQLLAGMDWAGVILDEAQNIKNPEARQSRAVRTLKGRFRLALTGTPVENRLSELWSIFEFLNPGFLGSFNDFSRRFAVPVERYQDGHAASRLKRLTQPFLLRRLKTDRRIISDLPEKLEMKVYCNLTREQATLYQAVVRDMSAKIESAEGIARRGLVLATLTKLKQVLNHPAHFLGDGSPLPGRSGKLSRLTEMLEEALSAGDSALVFTQYTEMGEMLNRHLRQSLLEPVLFFHGGLTKTARDRMVEDLQGGRSRIMVLSLKAGGTGLNLTKANHVFHFDRWWNPAVENQATDRAFRIGQTKKVQVHKFLCAGTLEEKIDQIIESKKALAGQVLGTGENWLTELSNSELRDLFSLRQEALEEVS
jgi:SNF2 family DNA or RNA helicase